MMFIRYHDTCACIIYDLVKWSDININVVVRRQEEWIWEDQQCADWGVSRIPIDVELVQSDTAS